MEDDKQVSSAVVWAGVFWALGIALTLAGTLVLLVNAESLQARALGLTFYAHSMLAGMVATCLTVRVMLRRQTKWYVDALRLAREGEAGRPLRQIR